MSDPVTIASAMLRAVQPLIAALDSADEGSRAEWFRLARGYLRGQLYRSLPEKLSIRPHVRLKSGCNRDPRFGGGDFEAMAGECEPWSLPPLHQPGRRAVGAIVAVALAAKWRILAEEADCGCESTPCPLPGLRLLEQVILAALGHRVQAAIEHRPAGFRLWRDRALAVLLGQSIEPRDHVSRPRRRKRRGRRSAYDAERDARIARSWVSGSYRTFDELAREIDKTGEVRAKDVRRAIDRHRKRRARRG